MSHSGTVNNVRKCSKQSAQVFPGQLEQFCKGKPLGDKWSFPTNRLGRFISRKNNFCLQREVICSPDVPSRIGGII